MSVDVSATIAGIQALQLRLDTAVRDIVGDAADIIQENVRQEAPKGIPGNSTNAPGDLARSVDITGPHGGAGEYGARIGPTTVYARQRELGGDIFPVTASALVFTKFGETVRTGHVYQKPNPYTLRGEMASLPEIRAMAEARVGEAILGR